MDLTELLGEELLNQVQEKIGDKKLIVNDGSYVPKARLDEVIEQRDEYKNMLKDRDKQLEELKEKAKGSEELTEQIEELKKKNNETQEEYEKRLKQQQFDFALERAIDQVKGPEVKTKAVRALLKEEDLKLDDEGQIKGLEAQVEELKKSDPYLFQEKQPSKGGDDFSTGNDTPEENPWHPDHFNLTKQGQIYREDPQKAERLKQEAEKDKKKK